MSQMPTSPHRCATGVHDNEHLLEIPTEEFLAAASVDTDDDPELTSEAFSEPEANLLIPRRMTRRAMSIASVSFASSLADEESMCTELPLGTLDLDHEAQVAFGDASVHALLLEESRSTCLSEVPVALERPMKERSLMDQAPAWMKMSKKKLAAKIVFAFAVLALLGFILSQFLGPFVQSASEVFVQKFSFWGLFLGFFLLDATPLIPAEQFILIGLAGGMNFWVVFASCSIGSILSAPLAWCLGSVTLFHVTRFQRFLERHGIAHLLKTRTLTCVGLSALIPVLNYDGCNWCAGALRANFWKLLLGATMRAPRLLITCYIIRVGWFGVK